MATESVSYDLVEVFTPTTPARVTFVDRDKVNNKLVNALTTPGMQLVVYGHSGTGKTTLLVNKLRQLYSFHVTTRCMRGTKFADLILDAFSQLDRFYLSEEVASRKNSIGFEASTSYALIKSKIAISDSNESSGKNVRYVPPQLTPQTLGKLLGEAGACWVLEDFHKISSEEKVYLSQMMKVFMDMSDDYPDLKVVAIGAVDTGRQVVDYDAEMKNRVAEIPVDLMTDVEIESIINKGQEALNIKIPGDLKRFIVSHANGLPATCHHLCLKICRAANILRTLESTCEITRVNCEDGLKEYIEECSDSIKAVFDNALKERRRSRYQQPALVLYALTHFGIEGASRQQLHQRIKLSDASFPEPSLRTLLNKLVSQEYSGVLRFDDNSALYSFSDPVYKAYAMARLKQEHAAKSQDKTKKVDVDIAKVLDELRSLVQMIKSQ